MRGGGRAGAWGEMEWEGDGWGSGLAIDVGLKHDMRIGEGDVDEGGGRLGTRSRERLR